MNDDLELFGSEARTEPAARAAGRRSARRAELERRRRSRRRLLLVPAALLVLALAAAGLWYGYRQVRGIGEVRDYAGPGDAEVVVQVQQGDSTSAIATRLVEQDVVASPRAFVQAAEADERVRGVQPGYYQMRARMSGAQAVVQLLDPASRVGRLEVRGGEQLDDVRLPDGTVVPGILSKLATASCATVAGASTCVAAPDLAAAMSTTEPAALGVPGWAAADVAPVAPERRLEGLVAPGSYDVRPGATPVELLTQLVRASAARLESTGLPGSAQPTGLTPYQVLVVASIIEREAIAVQFGQVSRVIYNRLADGMPLQMDSTINYPLDVQQVRTAAGDRATPGPYNTYLNQGLPVSPIGSPSSSALAAAVEPDEGPWRYFVKCQTDGTSCFTVTIQEHEAAVADAVARGVF